MCSFLLYSKVPQPRVHTRPSLSDSWFSHCRALRERSELHRGFSSVTYFIHSIHSVCGAIPISPFLPPLLFPLGIHVFVLYICVSLFALQIRSSVHFALCINIQCLVLSFWLTSPSVQQSLGPCMSLQMTQFHSPFMAEWYCVVRSLLDVPLS